MVYLIITMLIQTIPHKRFWAVSLAFLLGATAAGVGMPVGYAEGLPQPQPVGLLQPSAAFEAASLRGVKIDPTDLFKLDFLLEQGDTDLRDGEFKEEAGRLVRYFLACLTMPGQDLWVNLSPYEADRIIPDTLALTELGRDLLGDDYILKQLASSLTYPETEAWTAWAKLIVEALKAMLNESLPPLAHRRPGPVQTLANLRVGDAFGRPQYQLSAGYKRMRQAAGSGKTRQLAPLLRSQFESRQRASQ